MHKFKYCLTHVKLLFFIGGFFYHFYHDPLPLEFTMDPAIFIFTDDSKEKISVTTLFLIFVIWVGGMAFGLLIFAIEVLTVEAKKVNLDVWNRKL